MEYAAIRALLDKYWEAETTLEEESALAAYFRQPDIDPRLRPFREMFVYFEQESRVTPGEGFEKRILEAVRRAGESGELRPDHGVPVRRMWRGVNGSYAAAAAVILVIGLFIMVPSSRRAAGPAVGSGTSSTVVEDGGHGAAAAASVKDTYEDPQQALAAIRHALFTASARMNQGKAIAQKNMDRVAPALQTVKKVI
ncbi:MAG TPA: hypothetical protein VNU72_01550 [Puia sp.]|nr:hypothetical protein [Puia sp.]